MSLSTDIEVRHILLLSDLYEKEDDLREKLSDIHDEIVNLLACMSEDDIKEAKLTYQQRIKERYDYDGSF